MTRKKSTLPGINPVAKHAGTFNKAFTHVDRKKAAARGYTKHIKQGHMA